MNFEKMSEKEILAIATPIMDGLMDASTKIDHAKHIHDFSERLKNIVKKGFFKDRQCVATFKRPESAAIIWKQSYCDADGEFVAEMVLIHKDGEFLCDHVMVF